MSTPIIELIAENIETTLNGITAEAGFNQDLRAIRSKRNDFSDIAPEDGVVLIAQQGDERAKANKPDESEEDGTDTMLWNEGFLLMALVINSDTNQDAIDFRRNQVKSDIRKQLLKDTTRGGYARDTFIGGADLFDDGQGFSGIAVHITVEYRTKYEDPYMGI